MLEHFQRVVTAPEDGPAQIYAAQLPIDDLSPALREDLATPPFAGERSDVNLWLGLGAATPLHWDASDNLLVQVCGAKHVRLYSPAESRRLYPFRSGEGPRNASRIVDIARAERSPAEWPGFAEAEWEECWLGAGDMLYIPEGWWHAMASAVPTPGAGPAHNCSVNFWWPRAGAGAAAAAEVRGRAGVGAGAGGGAGAGAGAVYI